MLGRRDHSAEELTQKLRKRGFQDSAIASVLYLLESKDLLNPFRFAEQYLRYRANKGFGPIKIERELHHKGVDRAVIDRVMATWAGDWEEVLVGVYNKKYSETEPDSETEWRKRARYLVQRGFSSEQIGKILSR